MFDWLFNDPWGQLLLTSLSTSGIAAQVVALTPTKKDDKAMGYVGMFVNVLAGNYLNAKSK